MLPSSEFQSAQEPTAADVGPHDGLHLPALRWAYLAAWAVLLIAFWLLLRDLDSRPVEFMLGAARDAAGSGRAAAGLLVLYLLRPLLLVPITALNLTAGLVFGPFPGIPLAVAGTLLSASVGYGLGRLQGSAALADSLARRWRFVRMLRSRSFEAVLGGGLMYLHADMVNLPAGILRIPFTTFLLGICVGNALTLTMAVLAGASFEGSLRGAASSVNFEYVAAAVVLFLSSVLLARVLRRRLRPDD